MSTIKQIRYKNCELFKYHNGRVIIYPKENTYIIDFKSLSDIHAPRAKHNIIKGKIVSTMIMISEEAAQSLVAGLMNQFRDKQTKLL
jgi:hypothetical protein